MLFRSEGRPEAIEPNIPVNYRVVGFEETDKTIFTYIEGEDNAWTLEDIRARLEHGLYFGLEELPADPFLTPDDETYIQNWPKEE